MLTAPASTKHMQAAPTETALSMVCTTLTQGRAHLDAGERERLLCEHLPEVRHVARSIHDRLPLHVPLDDLVHAGVIGLIDAVDKFDPSKRVQLKSYAKFRIRGAILDSLRANDWSPRRLRRQARRLEQARLEAAATLGRSPSETELAGRLGMSLPDFQHLRAELRGLELSSFSVDSSPQPHRQSVWACCPDGGDPYFLCLQSEMKSHLTDAMDDLEERDRQVLALYYIEELTMKEVGAALGIGESRVSQIHSAAVTRLRKRLEILLRPGAAPETGDATPPLARKKQRPNPGFGIRPLCKTSCGRAAN